MSDRLASQEKKWKKFRTGWHRVS